MKALLLISTAVFSGSISAQCNDLYMSGGPSNIASGITNGAYIQENILTKRMIPYEYVREADVTWSKRIWRTIDLREKINHPMYYPFDEYDSEGHWVLNSSRYSLWTIMKRHILNGDLKLFSPYNPYMFSLLDGDQFKYPIVPEAGKNYCTDSIYRSILFSYLGSLGPQPTVPYSTFDGIDSTRILDDGSSEFVYPPRDTTWILSKDIVQYRLKEDWFFDKERSVMDVRILGICPVIYNKDENGQILGLRELFWLYFPHCRYVFNNYYVYNEQNDAQWMSFDDLFWKRQFSSTVYKESNVFDRNIETYRSGVDALMESEKITEEIRNFESDIWQF